MLISAKHYLDFEIKEPQLDAMVDVASEEGAIDEAVKKKIKKTAKGMPDEKAGKIATSTAMKKKIKEAILAKLKKNDKDQLKRRIQDLARQVYSANTITPAEAIEYDELTKFPELKKL
jgi:hypothetical protein